MRPTRPEGLESFHESIGVTMGMAIKFLPSLQGVKRINITKRRA